MEEKEIIKGEFYNVRKVIRIIRIAIIVIAVFSTFSSISSYNSYAINGSIGSMMTMSIIFGMTFIVIILLGITAFINFWLSKMSLVVTNKRVYGTAAFSKRIDLPLDMISAIGTCSLKGVSVSTSSGTISFLLTKNQEEVHEKISSLLIERQDTKTKDEKKKTTSTTDELREYKKLLDEKIISKEEFEKKKKELLK